MFLLPSINGSSVENVLKGSNVLVVDDSIVRGNNSKRARNLLVEAGVKKIYFASYTPPIGILDATGNPTGCTFGVDMPPNDNFIARNRTIEEISRKMGMNIIYLPLEKMLEGFEKVGISRRDLCFRCVGGEKP